MTTIDPLAPLTRFCAGHEWLQAELTARGITPSPLALRVADLLGELAHGIYHIDDAVYSPASVWDQPSYVSVCLRPGSIQFATVDSNYLTQLVFLSLDYGLRVSIDPRTFQHLTLTFHQRTVREGGSLSKRCPTPEQALAAYRSAYPMSEVSK